MPVSPSKGLHRNTTELSPASVFNRNPSELNLNSGSVAMQSSGRLRGKHIAMVTFSPFPSDPRPRRAIEAFLKEGATLELVCVGEDRSPKREMLDRLEVMRLPIRNRRGGKVVYAYQYSAFIFMASAILGLRALRRRYDLVYVNNMPDILVVSGLIPKMLGAKVILDLHDPMPELMMTIFEFDKNSLGVRLMSQLEKWSIARANFVLTVNLACKRIFGARSCNPEKIGVIMNAPDGDIFTFTPVSSYKEFDEATDKPFVIMYHGSLVERNGLDLAVNALKKVRESIPSTELRIYGKSSPYLERVLASVRAMNMDGAVRYLGPRRLEDLVPEILNCDLGIVPNQRNAFTEINTPTRIFEYLALGKPVIAPRTPGIQDYFIDGSLLFFESGDCDDLARTIEYAYCNRLSAIATAKRGQEIYLAHTWEQEKQTLIDLVGKLLVNGDSD